MSKGQLSRLEWLALIIVGLLLMGATIYIIFQMLKNAGVY
jgi:uncharacterized protein (UPF0333 family)